jgi:hypothetical protein
MTERLGFKVERSSPEVKKNASISEVLAFSLYR